jgi:hypothetical protein
MTIQDGANASHYINNHSPTKMFLENHKRIQLFPAHWRLEPSKTQQLHTKGDTHFPQSNSHHTIPTLKQILIPRIVHFFPQSSHQSPQRQTRHRTVQLRISVWQKYHSKWVLACPSPVSCHSLTYPSGLARLGGSRRACNIRLCSMSKRCPDIVVE